MREFPYWNTPFLYLYGGGSLYSIIWMSDCSKECRIWLQWLRLCSILFNKKWWKCPWGTRKAPVFLHRSFSIWVRLHKVIKLQIYNCSTLKLWIESLLEEKVLFSQYNRKEQRNGTKIGLPMRRKIYRHWEYFHSHWRKADQYSGQAVRASH